VVREEARRAMTFEGPNLPKEGGRPWKDALQSNS
jgi:hypothetical protein